MNAKMNASVMSTVTVTPRGLERLQGELEALRTVKRREIAQRLHDVVSDGELDENAAYEALKFEQAFLEGRIAELEDLLGRAHVVKPSDDATIVSIGCTAELQSSDGSLERFTVVGATEADPRQGRISYASPLGQALLDHSCGDQVFVDTPDGELSYRILSIILADANRTLEEN
jgi:transcription elongation factor GreA